MNTELGVAVALGVVLGVGVWSLVARAPRFSAPRLARRIAGSLADVSAAARDSVRVGSPEPAGALADALAPLAARAARVLRSTGGGDAAIARLLRQAGLSDRTVSSVRVGQLAAAALSGVGGTIVAVVLVTRGGSAPAALVILVAALVAGGGGPALLLRARARARQRAIAAQWPVVLDLLALALTAGESIAEAMVRVAALRGESVAELRRTMADSHAGIALPPALERMARDLDIPVVTRSVDHLVSALDHGAPLAEVLRAQADDAREEQRRQLIERAGRQEVAMMVPLVLLILPVTVLFALAPASTILVLGS